MDKVALVLPQRSHILEPAFKVENISRRSNKEIKRQTTKRVFSTSHSHTHTYIPETKDKKPATVMGVEFVLLVSKIFFLGLTLNECLQIDAN